MSAVILSPLGTAKKKPFIFAPKTWEFDSAERHCGVYFERTGTVQQGLLSDLFSPPWRATATAFCEAV